MEAKDTVMKQCQAWNLKEVERKRIGSCAGIGTRDQRMNWDDEVILKAQAEISFKAGVEKVVKWVEENSVCTGVIDLACYSSLSKHNEKWLAFKQEHIKL